MTAPFNPPKAIDLLEQAVAFLRPRLGRSLPINERLKNFWAGCMAARDLGASDVIEAEFLALGREYGIAEDLGGHGDADLKHLVRMAMLGSNPFQ